jgi:hypothetical protein
LLGLASALLIVGCGEDHTPLGPEVKGSALAGSSPKSPNAKQFSVAGGQVSFAMEAADEKIRGRSSRGVSGTLFVDAKDLTLTTGNIVVDLDGLAIYRKERQEDGTFKDEALDDTQNLHAKQWFEIDQSTPAPIRDRNRRVEFRISSVESASEKDVSKLSGETRTVTLKAKGEFLLHQRQSTKNVDLEVTFTFEGDNATAIKLKTVAPFGVKLAEHDVRPRKGFGKLAKEGLEAMGSKVAKEALVEIDVTLVLGDEAVATAAASAMAPQASASAPTPDDSASADASASADVSASAEMSASAGASAGTASASGAPNAAPTASASAKPTQK